MEQNQLVNTASNPQSLIQLAIESKLPIEHLEKLMALKERYDAIEAKKEFLTSMNQFQGLCPVLEKTKLVSFGTTKYKYAPLGEITEAIKSPMKETKLSFRWEMTDETDKLICTCIVSHISGHNEKSTMSAEKDKSGGKNEIQSRGSTITYLQRYTLIAALGISTADEDVDGRTDDGTPPTTPKAEPKVEDKREWLNLWTSASNQYFTKAGLNTIEKLKSGAITMETVKKNYKVSKEVENWLIENTKP